MVSSPSAPQVYRNSEPISLSALLVFTAAFFGTIGSGRSQERSLEDGKTVSVREKIQPSLATATWHGATPEQDSQSPAICVKKAGWYVFFVPAGSETGKDLSLTINGVKVDSRILATDSASGLCLAKTIESPENSPPLTFSVMDDLVPGSEIISLSGGKARVAGKDREYLGEILPISMLRIHLSDAAENHRGDPVFCLSGKVAGLLTNRTLQNENEAHAIPAAQIAKFVEDYDQHQQTGKIWIGASFHRQSTIPEVVTITPDSPAEAAGLEPGDIVLQVDRKPVTTLPELAGLCENLPLGRPVKFEILRGLKTLQFELTPVLATKKP